MHLPQLEQGPHYLLDWPPAVGVKGIIRKIKSEKPVGQAGGGGLIKGS